MLKPTGYYVLVKMHAEKNEIEGGVLDGFVMNADETERDNKAKKVGKIESFGPAAWAGYDFLKGETAEQRAEEWGVCIGDTVEFGQRYAGITPDDPDYQDYRLIQDSEIIGKVEE